MRSAEHGRAGQNKLRGREWQTLRTHADNTKGEAYHFESEALPDEIQWQYTRKDFCAWASTSCRLFCRLA